MLYVNYQHIPDWESKFLVDDPESGKRVESPWVFVIGILSIHTGINKITEDNAADFYMRCKLVEACFGGGLMQQVVRDEHGTATGCKLVGVTPEVIHTFIGVGTNASTYTEAQFFKHLRTDVVRELRQHYAANATRKREDASTTTA